MRIVVAFRAFFAALFSRAAAERIARALTGTVEADRATTAQPAAAPAPRPAPAKPTRSEALTLLATLQREARFVDFIQESLDSATDEQIGAVVRDVHRDCADVLERLFAIRALTDQEEGSELEVPAGFDAAQFRLTGNVQGDPPYRGKLGHHGWQATRCDVPSWSGSQESSRVIAPADVEL